LGKNNVTVFGETLEELAARVKKWVKLYFLTRAASYYYPIIITLEISQEYGNLLPIVKIISVKNKGILDNPVAYITGICRHTN
jgi:hypothetical protein